MLTEIQISTEDVNRIVVSDLKDAFSWNLPDDHTALLNAIEVVLAHYMRPSEYTAWFQARGRA